MEEAHPRGMTDEMDRDREGRNNNECAAQELMKNFR